MVQVLCLELPLVTIDKCKFCNGATRTRVALKFRKILDNHDYPLYCYAVVKAILFPLYYTHLYVCSCCCEYNTGIYLYMSLASSILPETFPSSSAPRTFQLTWRGTELLIFPYGPLFYKENFVPPPFYDHI